MCTVCKKLNEVQALVLDIDELIGDNQNPGALITRQAIRLLAEQVRVALDVLSDDPEMLKTLLTTTAEKLEVIKDKVIGVLSMEALAEVMVEQRDRAAPAN